MILPITEKKIRKVEIDLTGPDGNVFNLMNVAYDLAQLLNERRGNTYMDPKAIVSEMIAGDYENAIKVMEKNFGHLIIMYR